ncbi:glutamyl-tRNA synthetase [Thermoanaerobacter mathranii subsp. mathranii str. A3]|jgi:glutamyl-tRNA synthetase|uniref:Glutamate--tRNA ligase n=2 Tax=Thermoanaerobacter TaxID=1754 RepID=A0ABT9M3E3_9THEO|nr:MULTISPECIES: glutamate--tRNA ligase [Thermoanaerobacter]ADH60645.1 glutamyl-tRNA synthetase [Thermoanaerobacter mathranii subsp. mathranii str. A3]MBT1280423.1 glutamate--tRNA ligase [Thermoanaerobacter sp. CM-CNRG TB177]MDP9750607.1 glutamyl-tRNA synthetase [Thermoanaerobacter pentosaceus]
MGEVRVRFAPSPTGSLHIGGARTALFNWLFARHYGGKFILRVDDTDLQRSTKESMKGILDGLKWLGIDWDEGPIYQSQRLDEYRKFANKLLDEGKAYYCFCTKEELEEMRRRAENEGRPFMYTGKCRNLTREQIEEYLKKGKRPVIRLKVPSEGKTIVHDIIRGDVEFDNSTIDDFIIMKSDNMPTYNFATVVDDYQMGITHVIRAEEHLSNTPKQILIYEALGLETPQFAHVSMVLAPDRSKLSKRHGATSVQEFEEQGYLPEAIVNYITLLGWMPKDGEEIFDVSKSIKEFTLERVSKNPAVYDVQKLTWINGHYIRNYDLDKLTEAVIPFLKDKNLIREEFDYDYIKKIVSIVREREKTLVDIADAMSYYFTEVNEYEEKGVKKYFTKEKVAEILKKAAETLKEVEPFDKFTTEKVYRKLVEELQISSGELFHPTRLAISGRTFGPGLFDIMELLGKERTIQRIEKALDFIEKMKNP